MDSKVVLGLGVAALVVYLVAKNNNANAATTNNSSPDTGNDATNTGASMAIDLSDLTDNYPAANVQSLQNLSNELANGRGLYQLQMQMMLAQACQETGLLTDSDTNWNAVTVKNNYAGISPNGSIETFASISDFCDTWVALLSKGASPITADNIADFNNRLVANHYYTDSPTTYGNNLATYFNIISNA